jgi:hypothetical protein
MGDGATDIGTRETGLIGGVEHRSIEIVPYRDTWPDLFAHHAQRIGLALGDAVLRIEHIGSTAVAELAAKPIFSFKGKLAAKGWPDMNADAETETDFRKKAIQRARP